MNRHVALFAPYVENVGTKGTMLRLATEFEESGFDVDLLRTYSEWSGQTQGRVVDLSSAWSSAVVDTLPFPWKKLFVGGYVMPRLVRYLRRERPDAVLSGLLGSVAVAAVELARVDTAVVVSVQGLPREDFLRNRLWTLLLPRADRVVTATNSLAHRTADIADMSVEDLTVIPDPVLTDDIDELARETPSHPWFDEDVPVVVAVGRQTEQKDFSTLLRAIARLRNRRDVRLVHVGKEGDRTQKLHEQCRTFGIDDAVAFLGFVDNPYAFMSAADVFVLSSRWEGPGHVLVEALGVGVPVVATDCPSGPREILDDGAAGNLVPVGDDEAMAEAISRVLDEPDIVANQTARGREVVEQFRAETVARKYADLLAEITSQGD